MESLLKNFVRRYKLESRDVEGAPKCIRISGFVHGITNPELIKRLHDKIPKTVYEMMRVTTSFLRGEVAASNHEQKKSFPPWKQQEGNQKKIFRKGSFQNQQSPESLTKTPKEIFALEKGKFKVPPPMTTPVEKRNHAKFCEFHGEERVARRRITQSFSSNPEILFPPLDEDEGTEGPMIIEAEIGGHYIHRIEIIWPIGQIQLLVRIGDEEHSASAWMNFVVVRSPSPYNGIIGRPGVRKLQAAPSMAHGMLKLLVEGGVITLRSSRQKKIRQAADRNQAIQEEVGKLVEAGIMKEVHYHDWLSNPVMRLVDKAFHKQIGRNLEVPRVSVKGQILADFIVERLEEESPDTLMEVEEELPEPWILFTDGSSCINGSGAGLILTNPEGIEITYALRFRFDATNNEAEYEDLIARLRIAKQIVRTLTSSFKAFSIRQIPRIENKKADTLSKIASISFAHLSKQVLVEELKEKSISKVEILAVVEEEGDTWMTPIFEYLKDETLPTDVKKARAVRRKSQRFAVINGILYKKSFLGSWLRCVGPLQANYVLREIHEGSCNMHADTQSIVAKASRIGYYWPTMHKDARALIRACQDCQVHKPLPRNPQQKLTPITSPWLFYK
ncbi:reverse transcriptase domain-containing protein [Tanacetum coccineum]|uniref:Reverse transcriptase domain-containing protein n=1 Tax=Tanacetum coccineum TaxID=301880 RepID=A0ABQ5D8W1_9ASTR